MKRFNNALVNFLAALQMLENAFTSASSASEKQRIHRVRAGFFYVSWVGSTNNKKKTNDTPTHIVPKTTSLQTPAGPPLPVRTIVSWSCII